MFESFEGRFDAEPHRIPKEQLTKVIEDIAENEVFVVSEDSLIVDRTGVVYLDIGDRVYGDGNKDDCHDMESFLYDEDCAAPVFVIKTPLGWAVDASEVYEQDFDYFNTERLPEHIKDTLGTVIAFAETHDGASQMYEPMQEEFGIDFAEQTHALLAEYGALTSPESDEED